MSKGNLSPQRAREQALFLYCNALERGDFKTVAAISKLAETDPVLDRMIAEVSELLEAPSSPPQIEIVKADSKRGIEQVITLRHPSSDGQSLNLDHPQEDDKIMFTTFDGTIRTNRYHLQFLTAIASALILLVLGTLLLNMASQFAPHQEDTLSLAGPTLAGCQVADDADAQAESLRLAGEAQRLLDAETPDTELATLLGICALQIGYSPEADTALQQVFVRANSLPNFETSVTYVWGLNFTSDGQALYTAGAGSTISLWDIQTGEELRKLPATGGGAASMALSPDDRYLLTGAGFGGSIYLQDVQTGEVLRTFNALSAQYAHFSPDGKYVLTSSSRSAPVTLWDVSTGEELRTFDTLAYGSLSPDGRFVATIEGCLSTNCSPQTINIYDTQSGQLLHTFETDIVTSYALNFSHDGRYLVTGQDTFDRNPSHDTPIVIQLWDVETGTEVHRLEGHTGMANSLIFSADDKSILSAAHDGTARVWDTETGHQLRIFPADNGGSYVSRFSPDGRQLAIGYQNGTVNVWHTDYRDLIADACAKATRDFTAEERAQYGISGDTPTCPQFGENYELPAGMTPIPVQPLPVWTPLPPLEGAGS